MEKTDTDIEKYIEKNVEKSSKIDPRTTKKHGKSKNDQNITKKSAWGANFWPRRRFWVDFEVPGEAKKQTF